MYIVTQISVITSILCAALFYSVKGGAKFQCKHFEWVRNLNACHWRGGAKFQCMRFWKTSQPPPTRKEPNWILWPFAHPLPLNNGAPGRFADSILGISGVVHPCFPKSSSLIIG